MGAIIENAIYSVIGKLAIWLLIVPGAIILSGYLIYIIYKIIQEIKKDG